MIFLTDFFDSIEPEEKHSQTFLLNSCSFFCIRSAQIADKVPDAKSSTEGALSTKESYLRLEGD